VPFPGYARHGAAPVTSTIDDYVSALSESAAVNGVHAAELRGVTSINL